MLQVGQEITKVYIRTNDSNPPPYLDKVASNWGPFHDASDFFELIRQNVSNGEVNYDVVVKKPFVNSFKAGDQFNLVIAAFDGVIITKMEIYGRFKDAGQLTTCNNEDTICTTPIIIAKTANGNTTDQANGSTGGSVTKTGRIFFLSYLLYLIG